MDYNKKHNEFIETEYTLNTEIQTEILQNKQNNFIYKKYMKSVMSVSGILCNFNSYFLETEYIQNRSFYFMDFMFDILLQS